MLRPLFKLDDLLPRTLLATVKTLDSVPELALTMSFAPDVIIANLIYFLKEFRTVRRSAVSYVARTCDGSYLCVRKGNLPNVLA